MADRLAQVSAQLENVRQLQSVVTAMRGIAASRVQRARALLAGGDAYSAVISRAIGQALTLLPADYRLGHGSRRAAVVLFCAEQGFAGAYSERVLDHGGAYLPGATKFLIGSRGGIAARERGLTTAW
uniref:F0F1 ATP synthase subunit gamma n=1 Tax=Bradyrhizobium guangdongense TaxID=1325090 RepID=UPI0018F7D97E